MVQEIISYIMIGFAVLLAVWKIIQRFRKKRVRKEGGCSPEDAGMPDKCYNCPQHCNLRDELYQQKEERAEK